MRVVCLLLLLILSYPAMAAQIPRDTTTLATLPILHEGRIKPLETFARAKLRTLSGRETLNDLSAIDWLLEAVFDPAQSGARPSIKLRNPDVMLMLGLEKKPLYSFEELYPKILAQKDIILSILKTPEEEWTQSQSDLILLQQEMAILEQLFGSFSALLPLNVTIPEGIPQYLRPFIGQSISYRDTLKFIRPLEADLKDIIRKKGEDVKTYTPAEQTLALLSFSAQQLRSKGQTNDLLKILPTGDGKNWMSPWEILSQGGAPGAAELLPLWQQLAKTQDIPSWNQLTQEIAEKTLQQGQISPTRLNIEYAYTLLHPHEMSMGFYILCLVCVAGAMLLGLPKLMGFAGAFLSIGAIIHILGLCARIYILERPPVSTLYETVLFVGAITVVYGFYLWWRRGDVACLMGAAIIGIFLHIVSFAKAGEADDLVMLDAVLNTRFWLATHVLCITTGYAFCLVVSAFAHYLLACRAFGLTPPAHITTSLSTATLLSLLFATVGTILGGIWADQSWGRFWGWDPKENGAMLITLWLIWAVHGRISGQMGPLFYQATLAYLSVIVALSWFGVNLLGVGLHSYGFTDSLALYLGVFVALQTAVVALLWFKAARHGA